MTEFAGHRFRNPSLLFQALTHKSFHNERAAESLGHNEVLEFLGDAVLNLVVSELLISIFPEDEEGRLSRKRASVVNEDFLSAIAVSEKLDEHIQVGKGERASKVIQSSRVMASVFEAVVGAVFLDSGYEAGSEVIRSLFEDRIKRIDWANDFQGDYKTRLQERVQEKFGNVPTYKVVNQIGPDHEKIFEIEVLVDGKVLGVGKGNNKKSAEQEAAKKALEIL